MLKKKIPWDTEKLGILLFFMKVKAYFAGEKTQQPSPKRSRIIIPEITYK